MEKLLKMPIAKYVKRLIKTPDAEPLMYRTELFAELLSSIGSDWSGKRVLEIGPKDGLDSRRISDMKPAELVMIDLPEKRELVNDWLPHIKCKHTYIEANLMYLDAEKIANLGSFDIIWCTGVLYHNAEQLRFIKKLYKLLTDGGHLVLESATLRGKKSLENGAYVEIHYPETYRSTGTITHLPSRGAIFKWLQMAGFTSVVSSPCFEKYNRNVSRQRAAFICKKTSTATDPIYYGVSKRNPKYVLGDAS